MILGIPALRPRSLDRSLLPSSIQLLRCAASRRSQPVRWSVSSRWSARIRGHEAGPGHETTARGPACEPSDCRVVGPGGSSRGWDPELFACVVPGYPDQRNGLRQRQGGGDEETRTPDPLLAKEMLFQLSYVPVLVGGAGVVGVSGLEPETSALSGQCSNQLS